MNKAHECDVNETPQDIIDLIKSFNKLYKRGTLNYTYERKNEEYYIISIPITGNMHRFRKLKKHFQSLEKEDNMAEIMIPLGEEGKYSDYFQKDETDYDNSDKIWEIRQKVNTELVNDGNKFYLELERKFEVSGDTIFNFNSKKVKYFKEIIAQDSECHNSKKLILEKMLDACNKFHHSPQNVSIIFKTGGLNNFKQGIANDRFDVFACEIENYYLGNKLHILENGNSCKMAFSNRQYLEKALDYFDNKDTGFDSFISYFYHIEKDSKFVTDLLNSGKQLINDCESIYRYLCLAFEYWIINSRFYCSKPEMRKCYLSIRKANPPGIILIVYNNFVSQMDSENNKLGKIRINRLCKSNDDSKLPNL